MSSRQNTKEKANVCPERREEYMFNFGLYLVLHHSILHELLFYCLLGEINISFTQEFKPIRTCRILIASY